MAMSVATSVTSRLLAAVVMGVHMVIMMIWPWHVLALAAAAAETSAAE